MYIISTASTEKNEMLKPIKFNLYNTCNKSRVIVFKTGYG